MQTPISSLDQYQTLDIPQQQKHSIPVNDEVKKLDKLVNKSNRILMRVKSTFPFDLFPDELIIEETKINFVSRKFLASEVIHSLPIDDVIDIIVSTTPFFSTMTIHSTTFKAEPLVLRYVKTAEALKARRIIQGVIDAKKANINLEKIPLQQLVDKTEEIGQTKVV